MRSSWSPRSFPPPRLPPEACGPSSSPGISIVRKLTVRISRYDPERDDRPRWETYQVEADPTDRVLDVLLRIKSEQDDTLALRYSCAHGVCGSDAMRINNFNRLACKTLVRTLEEDTLTIEP